MIELYQKESCPFCAKVRAKLSELALDYVCHNVPSYAEKKRQMTLIKLGGKEQVPFLIDADDGIAIYESDKIVEYLEKKYGKR